MLLVSAELFMSKICLVVPKWEGSIDGDDENDSNGENQSWSVATGTKRKTTKKSFKIKCKKIFLTDDQ